MIITKKDKKNKSNKTSILDRDLSNSHNKIMSILRIGLFLILALPFVIILIISSPLKYPSESELVFKECTFIKYKYEYHDYLRYSDAEDYLIYVEEYDEPLKISDITFDKADGALLSNLKAGEKVTVSIKKHHGTLFLYSMSCGDNYILSYEDYLSENLDNDKTIIITSIIFILFIVVAFLVDIIYKKTKGKSLYWGK